MGWGVDRMGQSRLEGNRIGMGWVGMGWGYDGMEWYRVGCSRDPTSCLSTSGGLPKAG